MRRHLTFLFLLLSLLLMLASPAWSARQFNGTNQELVSASAVDHSGQNKLVVAFWLWVDSFTAAGYQRIFHHTDSSGNKVQTVYITPSGVVTFLVQTTPFSFGDKTLDSNPSAGAWHHWVINFDGTVSGSAQIAGVWIDGVSKALTNGGNGSTTTTFPDSTLAFMADPDATWAAGRLAEFGAWGGIQFVQGDVDSLYNSGSGGLATGVQSGGLIRYWKLCGTASPEPATVGGINMTVTGATSAAHPVNTCAAATPIRRRVIIQ
jgi:hypothetical protein